ncbi:phosphoribosyltransferase family protein [Pleomorphovibrio marinus]|uniref:phosphoribosyltransferase family protein n=1 Tax=Pleomorphovibrio marinus TaxID=2164132 RepID=UPI000E0C6FF8|nr:phosphoribosyltransferase family protein [Pleomorphovibrio marinus]
MSLTRNLVLNHRQIQQKIIRIAHEIYERNVQEKELIFAGLTGMGHEFAGLLAEQLKSISPIEITMMEVKLNKANPKMDEVTCTAKGPFKGKCVILVDDVLNTGKTLAFGMIPFLKEEVKKIEVAVLVNRSHKLFPVSPDYTGLELATTLTEHITVSLEKGQSTVHLH